MKTLDASRWKRWTFAETEKLKELLDKGHFHYQIAKILNKSVESISARRIKIGLAKRRFKVYKWNNEEDKLLKQYINLKYPFWDIAKKLNKSKKQIQYRAEKMGFITTTHCKREEKETFVKKYGNLPLTHVIVKRFNAAKNRAKSRNIEFNITRDFLIELYRRQNGLCYYSNIEMKDTIGNRNRNNNDPYSLSIERVDSTRGYTKDNIVLCCSVINIMKNGLSKEEFLSICRKITENNSLPR